jgi:hypothetical protein
MEAALARPAARAAADQPRREGADPQMAIAPEWAASELGAYCPLPRAG